MGEEEEEISGLKPGAFEEGTHDGEPEKSEDQFIGKSMKELIELIQLARRTLVNFCREYTRIPHGELAEAIGITESAISKMLARGNAWKYI